MGVRRPRIGQNSCDRCGAIYFLEYFVNDGYDRYCGPCSDGFAADDKLDRGLDGDALSLLRACGILPCTPFPSTELDEPAATPRK